MDKLKGMASELKGKTGGNSGGSSGNSSGAGKEDYGDKGLDAIEKKTGHTQSRETNEKITDGGREQFEKYSGKQVPDKFSN